MCENTSVVLFKILLFTLDFKHFEVRFIVFHCMCFSLFTFAIVVHTFAQIFSLNRACLILSSSGLSGVSVSLLWQVRLWNWEWHILSPRKLSQKPIPNLTCTIIVGP